MKNKIRNLLSLLDDENQQTASFAMAELLRFESEIDPFICEIQETENVRLRKRVHQLQSILSIRRRRNAFARQLKNRNIDLLKGLFEFHFLWYDNDEDETIFQLWQKLLKQADKYPPLTLEELAFFMRKYGFTTIDNTSLEVDAFCIGVVLEELAGADFILCAIARQIAGLHGLSLKIVKVFDDFALANSDGEILLAKNDWKLLPKREVSVEEWNDLMILKLTASMLFSCAVSSDSFRYVYTIGSCLARQCGMDNLDCLPYPFSQS